MEIIIDTHILQSRIVVARFLPNPNHRAHDTQHLAVKMLINHVFPDTRGEYMHRQSGAPYIRGNENVNLSITHTRGIAAIAVNDCMPVGIDVEQVSNRVVRVLPRVAHQSEIRTLNVNENLPEAYTTAWTAKEAIYKAIQGDGIDFANHIIINFPTPIMYDITGTVQPIRYTAQEHRTLQAHCYDVVSLPLISSGPFAQAPHILTVAVAQKSCQ